MLSNRIQSISPSGIRKIFELAANNKGEYVNFSIGQPDFPVPEELKKAAKVAIDNNFNTYTSTAGLLDLREKIADKLNTKNNIPANSDDLIVTTGVAGGLFLAFSALLDPGDEIIVPDPYFVLYKELLNFMQVKPVYLDTYSNKFRINPDELKNLVTDKTKAILLNSPNNPTGIVYAQSEIEKIVEIAKNNNLTIISDEIYEDFDYDNKFFSPGSIYPQTITLNGFSKSHSITGWRIGYAHGPSEVIGAMNKLQQYSFVCAPSFAQKALIESWNTVDLSNEISAYKNKREAIWEGLKDKLSLIKPEGAFYAYIKMPEDNFVDKLIDNKVLAVPGNVFSQADTHFRISFATSEEDIQKGIEVLRKL